MKKCICIILLLFVFLLYFSFPSFAYDTEEFFSETEEKIFSIIDPDALDVLEEIGFTDFDDIGSLTLENIFEYFSEDFISKIKETIKHTVFISAFLFISGTVIMTSVVKESEITEYITVCSLIVICIPQISEKLKVILAVISSSSDFLLAYIPVFAALIAMSGNVATALSFNTLLLTASEIISKFLSSFAEKITGAYIALSMGFSLSRNVSLSKLVSAFSKTTSIIIGFVSSVFASFLTVKSVFSVNVDTVSAKGLRFIISSFIPVVGSAISDAYSTLLGSIGLLKSSVAIIGIAASTIINLPVLFEGVCICTSYNFLSFCAEALNLQKASVLLKAFSVSIRFLLLIQIFIFFVLVVSTAVMVNVRSALG